MTPPHRAPPVGVERVSGGPLFAPSVPPLHGPQGTRTWERHPEIANMDFVVPPDDGARFRGSDNLPHFPGGSCTVIDVENAEMDLRAT
jgi:hypothetical protein